eukprot:TRINITY_DN2852_c0_g1_i4.p1 TRINITY_DN2852_c0_g1~~TRINITY_DN2852_c0_g1_i4.p1  ORF type:complete len:380 (-),score=126.18 TRINITY_DN2852_c0_g1_i4:98-1237(-)
MKRLRVLSNIYQARVTPSKKLVTPWTSVHAGLHQDAAVKRIPEMTSTLPPQPPPRPLADSHNIGAMVGEIHNHLVNPDQDLQEMSTYYFDGQGKAVRPALTLIMAGAVNAHLKMQNPNILALQRQIALICEMWHTSSLLHDDVIDHAETRRGKMSVNCRWNASRSIYAGDFILGISAKLLAQTGNPDVVMCMSQILSDLVNGEFQQMASRSDQEDRFQLYLDKTFNKTASLMAYSCKSVAILASEGTGDKNITDMAYRYGQNIGIAFQLVDDWLDFVSSADQLGKPSGADLSLGLATAPVLFASQQFPQLNQLILRQFSQPGDVETAFQLVCSSRGLEETKELATKYSEQAMESIKEMHDSSDKQELAMLAERVINRMK